MCNFFQHLRWLNQVYQKHVEFFISVDVLPHSWNNNSLTNDEQLIRIGHLLYMNSWCVSPKIAPQEFSCNKDNRYIKRDNRVINQTWSYFVREGIENKSHLLGGLYFIFMDVIFRTSMLTHSLNWFTAHMLFVI